MGEFDDIIPEFLAESTELLETVEKGLLGLEQGQAEDDMVHTVFRAIHSIKGGAGFVGLTKIERLAHKMEDLLNLIRNHDLVATPAVTDALLRSLDVLTSLFERVDDHDSIDIDASIQALQAALNAGVGQEVRQEMGTVNAPDPSSGLPRFEVSEYTLRNKFTQGNVFFIHLNLSQLEARGMTPIQLVNEMLSMGEILDANVSLPDLNGTATREEMESENLEVHFDVLYATVLESDLLGAALKLDEGEARMVTAQELGLGAEPATAPTASAPAAPPATPAAPAMAVAAPAPASPQPKTEAPPAQPSPAAPADQAEPEATRAGEYLTFTLGAESYGVDILSVQEIIGMPRLTRLPRAASHMLGVMNLRGMVVPVLDLRRKLGLPVTEDNEPVVVVLHVDEKIMGAVVDGVSDVVQLDEGQIQDPPEFAGVVRREYLRGLSRHEEDMLILLELDRLLAPETIGSAA